MTESNSPFSLNVGTQLKIPSQAAWDLFIQPAQANWNHALQSFDATLGFHTGSILTMKFQALRGPVVMKFEILESSPTQCLVLEHSFRHLLFKHSGQICVRFVEQSSHQCRVEMQYVLIGPFVTRVWTEKKLIVNNIFNLWLESLKLQSERL